ncbi:MAG: efflux RND transporter permease subunit, partial [Bacteroidia bacterium]|nr:efflux RND transporter permease subunit [Bacteroidia bacterium]
LLKHDTVKRNNVMTKFFDWFNRTYAKTSVKYWQFIELIINRRVVTLLALIFFTISSWGLISYLPSGFIPTEDQGTIYVNVTTPSGSTLERTNEVMDKIQKAAASIPAVEGVSTLAGFSLFTDGAGASFGMAMITLKPWSQRSEGVDEIIEQLSQKTETLKAASIQFFPPPAVPGYGNSSGFECRIQDRTGSGDLQKLESVARTFVADLGQQKELQNVFTSYDASFPQYLLNVDNDKAAQKGISVEHAMNNLQALVGSYYATNFIRFGQMYKVMVQALPKYRAQPEDILKFYIKNTDGEMVPYSAFTEIERVYGPEQLTRYNMYNSAMINGEPSQGHSTGEAIKIIEELSKQKLPKGYTFDWSGMTRDEISSGNQGIYIFAICFAFVYLILSAQYESFLLPLPVLLSLPTGIFGAYFLLMLFGLQNNIYAQVALIMLIGLLGKNAILIVEFAILKQKEGFSPAQAVAEGAVARLRPIVMTSLAFIFGLIPLMVATGAGAIGNRTIGTAAAGGMLFGTLFGLIVIPGLYIIFARKTQKDPDQNVKQNENNTPLSEIISE